MTLKSKLMLKGKRSLRPIPNKLINSLLMYSTKVNILYKEETRELSS